MSVISAQSMRYNIEDLEIALHCLRNTEHCEAAKVIINSVRNRLLRASVSDVAVETVEAA